MPKFHTIKVGDILWDVHREKMGNTTMSSTGSWEVKVISIDTKRQTAVCVWNGNTHRPRDYYKRDIERLRRSPHKEKGALPTKVVAKKKSFFTFAVLDTDRDQDVRVYSTNTYSTYLEASDAAEAVAKVMGDVRFVVEEVS